MLGFKATAIATLGISRGGNYVSCDMHMSTLCTWPVCMHIWPCTKAATVVSSYRIHTEACKN